MNIATWPELSFEKGKETYKTIQLWTQIAGKIKLANLPWINHSWHVTLFVTPFGLTTGDIPYDSKHFQISFNFIAHELQIITSAGEMKSFNLLHLSVASCYKKIMEALEILDIKAKINLIPNEIKDVIPFNRDEKHFVYDPVVAVSLHHAFLNASKIFTLFRSGFIGKCSPVHFFWGGFDLAVSRFSGKQAPTHPGGIPNIPDRVVREAYSHEVYSCGFWPGNEQAPLAAFYSYIYPEPEGFKNAAVKPDAAYYQNDLGEFILPYEVVRQASDPAGVLLNFLETTYDSAANLAGWDRKHLEKEYQTASVN